MSTRHSSATSSNDSSAFLQFLTFRVATEEYGVELLSVQEIRAFSTLTPLPGSPPHVKGVINLRGVLVPVIGLRERLNLESIPYDRYTVIVVLHVKGRVVGVIVDAVSDVLALSPNEVDPSPDIGLSDRTFLRGLGKLKDKLITLLEPSSLIHELIGTATVEEIAA